MSNFRLNQTHEDEMPDGSSDNPRVREGDNSTRNSSDVAADRLRSFIERIERLEEEKRGLTDDVKEIYAEAKGTGFDVRIMRAVIKLRRMEQAERQEQDALIDLYRNALGID